MKPIIIDMKDISDSTEIYESRPNPVLAGFIYLILAMLIFALLWMYFFKIDIVVKGTGMVAAAEEVATITNQTGGIITEKKILDGQSVKKGDILYRVSQEEQMLQLDVLTTQLTECEEKEVMLKAYGEWLEKGEEFPAGLKKNLFYSEMVTRKQLVELGKQDMLQTYSGELSSYNAKLDANGGMLAYYGNAIDKSKQLVEAIKKKENCFNSEDTYYWNTMENYLAQCEYTEQQYNDKIEAVQEEKEVVEKEIEELEEKEFQLKQSGMNGVSDGDAQYAAIQEQLSYQKSILETANNTISQYSSQRDTALNAYEKESIAAVESNIRSYEQNVVAYQGNQKEYASGQNTLKEQGTEVGVGNLITQEKHSVTNELESCRQTKQQLQQQIEELNKQVEDATVKASRGGVVNLAVDLVEGNYVAAGTEVLSIIPDTESGEFIVRSYIENKDIAKIHEGMKVTYEIAAYPTREYGTLEGEVTFVSADLKVNNSGSAYYVVETSVDTTELCNSMGEELLLKIGMLCETKIVVEDKSVLTVLMEKVFHIT